MKVMPRSMVVAVAALGTAVFAQTPAGPEASALTEILNGRYANGVVAVADDAVITVADVVREVSPLLPALRQRSQGEQEYRDRVDQLADRATESLIERARLVRQFRQDGTISIPESQVDNAMADELAERFGGDRIKFLAHLRSQGRTVREYRRTVEDKIIYNTMRAQQREANRGSAERSQKDSGRADVQESEPQVHLRIIQLTRASGENDATLRTRAEEVLRRFHAGEKFSDLARELSGDPRRSNGGDWGWQKRTDFRKDFGDIAFGLKKGEASMPILLPEGAFILLVEDRK